MICPYYKQQEMKQQFEKLSNDSNALNPTVLSLADRLNIFIARHLFKRLTYQASCLTL